MQLSKLGVVCLSLQGTSRNASIPECGGPVSAQSSVQEESLQQTGLVSSYCLYRESHKSPFFHSLMLLNVGSGADGAEEIKRHGFFATIDWNVRV